MTGPYRKILYVDDQPSHVALFAKAFGRDYEILVAHSAAEALELIEEEKPFLVLADHNMPEMTGIELLEEVRRRHPEIIRAILSAYRDEELLQEAIRRADVFDYLNKPWSLAELRRFIRQAEEQFQWSVPAAVRGTRPTERTDRAGNAEVTALWRSLVKVTGEWGERPDAYAARYLLQTYGRKNMEHGFRGISRPLPEALLRAEQEAVAGNVDGVNAALLDYLRSINQEGICPLGAITLLALQRHSH